MAKKKYGMIHIPEDPPAKPSLLAIGILLVVAPPVTTFIGLYLGLKRLRNEWTRKRYQTYRRFANAIGSRATVSIRELAAETGMPTARDSATRRSMSARQPLRSSSLQAARPRPSAMPAHSR